MLWYQEKPYVMISKVLRIVCNRIFICLEEIYWNHFIAVICNTYHLHVKYVLLGCILDRIPLGRPFCHLPDFDSFNNSRTNKGKKLIIPAGIIRGNTVCNTYHLHVKYVLLGCILDRKPLGRPFCHFVVAEDSPNSSGS